MLSTAGTALKNVISSSFGEAKLCAIPRLAGSAHLAWEHSGFHHAPAAAPLAIERYGDAYRSPRLAAKGSRFDRARSYDRMRSLILAAWTPAGYSFLRRWEGFVACPSQDRG